MFKADGKGGLKDWVRRHLNFKGVYPGAHGPTPVVGFAIHHITASGPVELEAIPLWTEAEEGTAPEGFVDDWINKLAELCNEVTLQACRSIASPQPQRFELYVMFDGREPFKFGWLHREQVKNEDGGLGSEPPTATGLVTVTMRHLEARERGVWGVVESNARRQEAMIDRLTQQVDRLLDAHFRHIELQEEMLSRKAERDAIARKEERKDFLYGEVIEKFSALLPIAVYKLTGKNVLGAKIPDVAAATKVTDAFIDSISRDTFEALMQQDGPGALTVENKMLLNTMFQDRVKRIQQEDAEKKAKIAKTKKPQGNGAVPKTPEEKAQDNDEEHPL